MVQNSLELIMNSDDIEMYDAALVDIDMCGYFVAQIILVRNSIQFGVIKHGLNSLDVDYIKELNCAVHVIIESKFDREVKDVPENIYHSTHKNIIEKIMKIGLVPKSRNKMTNHPERVYFSLDEKFAKEFIRQVSAKERKIPSDFVILRIETVGLNVKFMQDPNALLPDGNPVGIYTYSNISPERIFLQ